MQIKSLYTSQLFNQLTTNFSHTQVANQVRRALAKFPHNSEDVSSITAVQKVVEDSKKLFDTDPDGNATNIASDVHDHEGGIAASFFGPLDKRKGHVDVFRVMISTISFMRSIIELRLTIQFLLLLIDATYKICMMKDHSLITFGAVDVNQKFQVLFQVYCSVETSEEYAWSLCTFYHICKERFDVDIFDLIGNMLITMSDAAPSIYCGIKDAIQQISARYEFNLATGTFLQHRHGMCKVHFSTAVKLTGLRRLHQQSHFPAIIYDINVLQTLPYGGEGTFIIGCL